MKSQARSNQREQVSAFDAKTHLSQWLRRVERGTAVTITRHGKPVAQLIPAVSESRVAMRSAAVLRLSRIRKGIKGTVDIGRLIAEGRKR